MKKIIGIAGATAVGKSSVAIELAKLLKTEIISADSMQIYKGMNVGTAKMSIGEMQGITHHMIDIVNPDTDYSSYLYQCEASKIIDNMESVPIVAGGTGFYFDSLLYPPEFGNVSKQRRSELQKILKEEGLSALRELLKEIDAETYSKIDLCNPIRVMRAIEIAESGGKRSLGKNKMRTPRYDCRLFVLECPREQLYERIDRRVEEMIENGLIEEVKTLLDRYGNCKNSAFSAIGYKEIIEYLQGETTLEQAVAKIKLNTRHYAKRQISYFKRLDVFKFIDICNYSTVMEISNRICSDLEDFV